MTTDQVLQIRVELEGIEPKIWRRILIGAESTFWDLHVALQGAMGWTDSHLHVFRVPCPAAGGWMEVGMPDEEDPDGVEPGWECDVADVLSIRQPRAVYEYDFGDGWEHGVVLEDILPADGGTYPRCVAGARACPPEDVGGPPGYETFLAAIGDPGHEEHAGYLEWVGGSFDAEGFDPQAVVFEDPAARWQEVYGGGGPAAVGPPQLEGGFAPAEVDGLLWRPFEEGSPLVLATDLPEETWLEAPLVRDMGTFLRLVAEQGPLKLTKKGNLPRWAVAHLLEAGALGWSRWWDRRPPRQEDDVRRVTVLKRFGEMVGWTKKRKGRLELTRRGAAVAEEKTAGHEVFRVLFVAYTTQYNWAFTDQMPESAWFRAGFWYVLWLLQEYGAERRPSSFYAEKFRAGLPWVMGDFPETWYSTAEEELAQAFEWRALEHFGVDFGMACLSEEDPKRYRDPREVWAGPLLEKVVRWRRQGMG